jgi:pimeloyl-ACP methyl ester carboxylesterase
MARFVLVHGAFVGGWAWQPLIEALEDAGHSARALDLPGSGDDSTPVAEVTLPACAARVCDVLAESREPAVLVGNSMGGIMITQAADRRPDLIESLVYVAAFLPRDGQSLLDLTRLAEGKDDQVQANLVVEGDPPVATLPDEASGPVLYGSCSEEVANWAIAQQRPQPVAPYTTPVSLHRGGFDRIERRYVLCTRDRAIPPPLQRLMLKQGRCTDVLELETDHSPHLSMTAELAEYLDRVATRSAQPAR